MCKVLCGVVVLSRSGCVVGLCDVVVLCRLGCVLGVVWCSGIM